MAQQTIDIGTTANDGTGDALRVAFGKANNNFTELYTSVAGKLASSAVDTDVAMAANSDAKVPSQKAARAYIAAQLTSFGSAATKDAGTAAGEVPVLDEGGLLETSVLPLAGITAVGSFTPTTPTSTSGAFTTVSATMKYSRIGKWVLVRGSLFVTTIGTAAGRAKIQCPIASTGGEYYPLTALKESGFSAAVAAVNWDDAGYISISLSGVSSGDVIHFAGMYAST